MTGFLNAFTRLARHRQAATAVEFALVAPLFLGLLFGVIETGRLMWMRGTLDEVAYSTARCMTISSACATLAQQRSYAVARAASYGVTIASTNVTATAGSDCDGNGASNKITIAQPFHSSLTRFLPFLPTSVSVHACFPTLT
ncbi:MAG: TadE/TadG family type IV pilus assembly protein [Pseudomonadota bacterium]